MAAPAPQLALEKLGLTYQILGEIGDGALAHVYKARRNADGKLVAIKVMREEYWSDVEARERLRREALAIRAIQSPHVCAIYDFDTTEKAAFIVMDFVEGTTLRSIIKKHRWNAKDISVVVGQIGEALHAAHAHQIVHRDLKPENIMLSGTRAERSVKVLDFGFAKLLEHERASEITELTQLGVCFGTPQYMSPEQILGGELDTASDLFALGVIAYEIVAGKRPWNGANPQEVMKAVTSSPIPPLDRLPDELAGRRAALEVFFASALARKGADRPSSARDFIVRFNRALGIFQASDGEDPASWFDDVTCAVLEVGLLDEIEAETNERFHSQWLKPPPEAAATKAPAAAAKPAASAPAAAAAAPAASNMGWPGQPAPVRAITSEPAISSWSYNASADQAAKAVAAQRRFIMFVVAAFVVGVALTALLFTLFR